MKKLLFLGVIASSSLYAALPPFTQSVREMEAILSDSKLHQLLGSAEGIQEVIRVEEGYAIVTKSYFLRVHVRYAASQMVGPGSFTLQFDPPIHLESGELYQLSEITFILAASKPRGSTIAKAAVLH